MFALLQMSNNNNELGDVMVTVIVQIIMNWVQSVPIDGWNHWLYESDA